MLPVRLTTPPRPTAVSQSASADLRCPHSPAVSHATPRDQREPVLHSRNRYWQAYVCHISGFVFSTLGEADRPA